jgi:hypothetical protein
MRLEKMTKKKLRKIKMKQYKKERGLKTGE